MHKDQSQTNSTLPSTPTLMISTTVNKIKQLIQILQTNHSKMQSLSHFQKQKYNASLQQLDNVVINYVKIRNKTRNTAIINNNNDNVHSIDKNKDVQPFTHIDSNITDSTQHKFESQIDKLSEQYLTILHNRSQLQIHSLYKQIQEYNKNRQQIQQNNHRILSTISQNHQYQHTTINNHNHSHQLFQLCRQILLQLSKYNDISQYYEKYHVCRMSYNNSNNGTNMGMINESSIIQEIQEYIDKIDYVIQQEEGELKFMDVNGDVQGYRQRRKYSCSSNGSSNDYNYDNRRRNNTVNIDDHSIHHNNINSSKNKVTLLLDYIQ